MNEALLARNFEVNGITHRDVVLGIELAEHAWRPAKLPAGMNKLVDGILGLPFFVENNLIIDYARMEVRQGTPLSASTAQRSEVNE